VLYGNSPRGRVRLEYYDSEKACQQERGKRIIPLVHCVSIKPVWNKDYNHVLEIVTSDKTFYLGASSKDEEKAWFKSLCKIVFGNANRNSIVQVLDRPDPIDMGYHSLDRGNGEENDLSMSHSNSMAESSPQLSKVMGSREKLGLDSTGISDLNVTGSSTEARNATSSLSCELSSLISFESGFDETASVASSIAEGNAHKYYVTVRPTIASQEAGMAGQYILHITPTHLTLKEMGTEHPVCEWPIQHLRRYGRGRTKFSFEAGDKCKTGVGVYTFNTREGDQIFHIVDMHARRMSNQQSGGVIDRRIHSHSQSFKPLSETRRRAKSEGRLLESSDDSTINEICESMENMALRFKTGDMTSSLKQENMPVLTDTGDQETEGQPSEGGVVLRPRSKTDVVVVKDREVGEQGDDLSSISTDSLLNNPANSEFSSAETVKAQDAEDINACEKEPEPSTTEGTSLTDGTDFVKGESIAESAMVETNIDHVVENEQPPDTLNLEPIPVETLKAESPFEPLLTSEHDTTQDNHVIQTDAADYPNVKQHETAQEVAEEKIVVNGDKKVSPDQKSSVDAKADNVPLPPQRGEDEFPRKRKSRKMAQRNKSFELGSASEKTVDDKKLSGSFSSFDHRKYRENNDQLQKGDHARRLQRFTSVKKTVEMYERISLAANDARQKSFTLWKRRSFKSSQKPEILS